MQTTLCVGTAGMSVWFSDDLGESWERPLSECGLYLESRVWALASHPQRPCVVFAGTDVGLYVGDVTTRTWRHLPSPMDGLQIWALAISPADPDLIVAGVRPAGIFRSADGGRTWMRAEGVFAQECIFVDQPRVTQVLFDPEHRDRVWCSIEIDGIHRSDDGGRSWRKVAGRGMVSEDIHGVAITTSGGRRLWAAANKGLHVSADEGETFEHRLLDTPPRFTQYTRTILPRADGDHVVFLSHGNGPPGDTGRLLHSTDLGDSWSEVELPGSLNSTLWCVATHPADPNLIFCASNCGQLFRSLDGGVRWTRLARELGEVRAIHWTPRA